MVYNKHMGNTVFKKTISTVTVMLIGASSFACSSGGREYEVIKESDPWYGCTSFEVADLYPSDLYDYVDYQTVGATDGSVYIRVEAEKRYEGDINEMSDEELLDIYELSILQFTFEGELIGKNDYLGITDDGLYRMLYKAWVSDGELFILEQITDAEGSPARFLLNGEEAAVPEVLGSYSDISVSDVYSSSGYMIYRFRRRGALLDVIGVVRPDGSSYALNPYDFFPEGISVIVDSYIPAEDGKVIIPVVATDNEIVYTSLDLEAGTLTELTGLYGTTSNYWMENCGDKIIARDYSGLNLVDGTTGDVTKLLDYNDADAPFGDILESETLYVSDDGSEIVLGTFTRISGGYGYRIMHLERAAVNPHAGKTVLTLTVDEDYYPDESDLFALNLYNRSSSSSFIKFVFPYNDIGEYQQIDADIILTGESYEGPSDKELYVDLSPYLDLDNERYFMNAIDAARSGDALYRVPLNITASGIMTASVNLPEGQRGFTFDSYLQFVDETCNGADPMTQTPGYSMSKPEYFAKLFMNMSELFISGGRVNLEGDEFRQLMMFVDEHGSEEVPEETGTVGNHNSAVDAVIAAIETHNARLDGTFGAVYGTLYSFDDYISEYMQYGEGLGVYGLPSFDGRGPQTVSNEFVSISAETAYPDECAEYIRLLLSTEVQEQMSFNPVNREALRTVAEEMLEIHNEEAALAGERGLATIFTVQIPPESVDRYMEILSSSYEGANAGWSVEEILLEESSAYFYGSRSLEDVIPVMQDRIQTVLDENS